MRVALIDTIGTRIIGGDLMDIFSPFPQDAPPARLENPEWVPAPYEVAFWFAKRYEQRYWTRKRRIKYARRQRRQERLNRIAQTVLAGAIATHHDARLLRMIAHTIATPILIHGDTHI